MEIILGFVRQSQSNIDTFALGPELVFTLLQALLLVGLIGLWRSGDVTEGSRARTLGRIALGAALLTRAIFVVAEYWRRSTGTSPTPSSAPRLRCWR